MKIRNYVAVIMFSFLIISVISCSKGDSGGSGGDGIFIPDLSNQWTNKADVDNQFFFNPVHENVNTSSFNGNENPGGGKPQLHFTGSFTNHQIQFTYDNTGTKQGMYSGTINDASKVITLTSTTLGSLVIQKP